MVSCLILSHKTIPLVTRRTILEAMLMLIDFEFAESTNDTTCVYLWNVKKKKVWQSALHLEFAGIDVGYGFGKQKKEAKEDAERILCIRNSMANKYEAEGERK